MGWSKELWQVWRRQLNDGRVPAGLGSVEMYLGMVCEMFIVGVTCVDWEVWFLPLDSWDCLPADPYITALCTLCIMFGITKYHYCIMFGITKYHYNANIITMLLYKFLFCFEKS